MKKALTILLAFAMVFALAACNGNDNNDSNDNSTTGTSTPPVNTGDGGASRNVADYWSPADGPPTTYDINHEVYTMSNRLPWTGIFAPQEASRASIDKAIANLMTKDGSNLTIGYATMTVGTPYFAYLMTTVRDSAEALGWTVNVQVSDFDIVTHIANIENFITMGVDVIINQSLLPEAELVAVEQAVAAGIPVFGVGMTWPVGAPIITNAAALFYEMGFELGIYVAEHFRDQYVKLALNPGQPSQAISDGKTNGFIGGFVYARAIHNGQPLSREEAMLYGYNLHQETIRSARFSDPTYNWDCVASIDGGWSKEGGQSATEDIITANPDINLLFAGNDEQAMGAALAIQQAGLTPGEDVIIVAVGDCSKVALEHILDGRIFAVMLFSPITSAKATVDILDMMFNKGFDANNLPSDLFLEIDIAHRGNASQWMQTGDDNYPIQADTIIEPLG